MKKRVLILDSPENALDVAKMLMANENYEIETEIAYDEGEVMEYASQRHFDMIFIDVDVLGIQRTKNLYDKLRAYPQTRGINILAAALGSEEKFNKNMRAVNEN